MPGATMPILYPDWLPLAQKSKTPKPDTGFRTDLPQVGAPIFQKLTDDLKTGFSLTWIFTQAQHRAFLQWLRSPNYLDNCNQWFLMPVGTGSGAYGEPEMQELHFVAYPTWNQSGSVFTWSGDVITRKLNNSDDDYDDIVIELPPPWASWLDIVVTGYPDNHDPETLPKSPIAWFDYRDNNLGYGLQLARASTATYIDGGVLKSAAVNAPRYESEGLLIEGESRNLIINSVNLISGTGSAQMGNGVSPTRTGGFIGPDNSGNAIRAQLSRGTASSSNRSIVSSNGAQWMPISPNPVDMYVLMSVWIRSNSVSNQELTLRLGRYTQQITVTNEYARFSVGGLIPAGDTDATFYVTSLYTGSALTADVLIHGLQVEKQITKSSYIPTNGVAVSRSPDQLTLIESGAKNLYREYLPLGSSSLIKELIPYAGELVPSNSHLRTLKVWDRELTDDEKAALGV